MTLSFLKLFLKKFWDQNSTFERTICRARSCGDSTYVTAKKDPKFCLFTWFLGVPLGTAKKTFFFLKGMTLSFQELFFKKFWDQNWQTELKICKARSGGDSSYVSIKNDPKFCLFAWFLGEPLGPSNKTFFFLKGMTLTFQELFLKKFWDQNWRTELKICKARSGGDSTYASTKKWFEILTLSPNLSGKRWSQLWNLFFSLKGMPLSFQELVLKKF